MLLLVAVTSLKYRVVDVHKHVYVLPVASPHTSESLVETLLYIHNILSFVGIEGIEPPQTKSQNLAYYHYTKPQCKGTFFNRILKTQI